MPGYRVLTPGEVATMFRVDPKTVTRWANAGKLPSFRTPGGHRRFKEHEVLAVLHATRQGRDALPPVPESLPAS